MGDAAGMDCEAVVAEMYFFLDGELTEARRVQISRHLTGCPPCHEVIDFHAELKLAISAKCREQVPDQLWQRIASALGVSWAPGSGIAGL